MGDIGSSADGSNHAVVCSLDELPPSVDDPARFDAVLTITFDGNPPFETPLTDSSVRYGLVSVGDTLRGATVDSSVPDIDRSRPFITAVEDPTGLDEIWSRTDQFLSSCADDSRVLVRFDSITALLRHVELPVAFRFLHALRSLLRTNDAVGYFYLDPDAHGNETIGTLTTVFDTTIDVTDSREPTLEATASASSVDGSPTIDRMVAAAPVLWIVAVFTFGIGDIATTYVGLASGVAVEASPIAAAVINDNGFGFIYVVKGTMFGLFYLVWRMTPNPYAVGVPLGLSLLGVGVILWNVGVLAIGFLL